MSNVIDPSVWDAAISEIRRRSKKRTYQRDFDAWAWDVLRLKNYEKMRSIAHDALFGHKERTLVKSGNGTGKSVLEAEMILWAGSVFDEGETVSIISAPSIPQLQKVTFAYLKSFHGRVSNELRPKDFQVPGKMDENLGWVSETKNGKIWLASGRKPPDQDAVSMFQGLRSQFGKTFVWFDEAGGMSKAMYTAAEAVMTGGEARFFGIGNPDNAGTDFQKNFTPEKDENGKVLPSEFNLHTITAYDTPVFTGERVYPHTVEGDRLERQMLTALTTKRWVAHKTRIWATGGKIVPDMDFLLTQADIDNGADGNVGDPDPRYFTRVDSFRTVVREDGTSEEIPDPVKWDARGLSKVLGEFPGDNDTAFFPQAVIDLAHETTIQEDHTIQPILGVDIARLGADESVVYLNRGGRCRLEDSWGRQDTVSSARRIHEIATRVGAKEVRIDAAGVGGGVFDMLKKLEEFSSRTYDVIGIDGGTRSSDPRQWLNARAENHDNLRTLMAMGKIDIEYDDKELKNQLTNVTFKFTAQRGAIQITPKDEMRTEMDGSPDRLDALIYATLDAEALFRAQEGPQPGDVVLMDPWEMLHEWREDVPML